MEILKLEVIDLERAITYVNRHVIVRYAELSLGIPTTNKVLWHRFISDLVPRADIVITEALPLRKQRKNLIPCVLILLQC